MFELSRINFITSYICKVDETLSEPIISNFDIDQEDELSITFIEKTIKKFYESNNLKWADFLIQEEKGSVAFTLLLEISEDLSKFKQNTKQIIMDYFDLVKNNATVPSGDFIVTLFEMNNLPYVGIFKYNYKTMLTSHIDLMDEAANVYILKSSSLYTSSNHKADEGFILSLSDMDIAVVEKKYTVNSDKVNIFTDKILLLKTEYSQKEKYDIFSKITKNVEEKYIPEDFEKQAKIKKAVKDVADDFGAIDVETVVEKAFDSEEQLGHIYKDSLLRSGLKPKELIEVPERTVKSKYQKQKLTTDEGIEINIPVEYYGDESKIEFVPGDDGNISIIIKNIKNITT